MVATESDKLAASEVLEASTLVVAAYLEQNPLPYSEVPKLIEQVHAAFRSLNGGAAAQAEKPIPAVPISRSVHQDYIICLEDGARLKMLKRYLGARFGMSPEDYRRKWGLPSDYPMVAPAYAAKRSAYAKQIGLGRGVRRK